MASNNTSYLSAFEIARELAPLMGQGWRAVPYQATKDSDQHFDTAFLVYKHEDDYFYGSKNPTDGGAHPRIMVKFDPRGQVPDKVQFGYSVKHFKNARGENMSRSGGPRSFTINVSVNRGITVMHREIMRRVYEQAVECSKADYEYRRTTEQYEAAEQDIAEYVGSLTETTKIEWNQTYRVNTGVGYVNIQGTSVKFEVTTSDRGLIAALLEVLNDPQFSNR